MLNGREPKDKKVYSPPAALAPPCGARTVYDAMRNFSIPRSEGKFKFDGYHIEKFFF